MDGVAAPVRRFGLFGACALLLVVFALLLPDTFLSPRNLLNITQQMSMLAVVAFAMTIVMVMNDFDLSVGSMASLAAITAAVLFAAGYPVWIGVGAGLAVGLGGGLINGVLVAHLRILPFVATLGTLTVFSGLAFLISDGKTIFGRAIPSAFSGFARGGIPLDAIGLAGLKLPNLTLAAFALFVVVWLLLERSVMGRRLYIMGSNYEAARLGGIPVRKLRTWAFMLTGLGAALAGLMLASRVASANPTQGAGLMLDAIACVFLGMTMSRQGEPRVVYTLVGVLILGALDNGLTQLAVNSYIREIVVGVIVLAAVASSSLGRGTR
ncbi:MAG: ABC transporter permease [Pseudomonadota bacterium]